MSQSKPSNDNMANVCMTGKERAPKTMFYAGDVSPQEAFDALASSEAVLIDVRTPQEWAEGQPDISRTASSMLSVSWKTLPEYTLNPNFMSEVTASKAVNRDRPVYLMCKGGGRSADAAQALAEAGYKYCYNIRGGFEGKPDAQGWKSTLPWKKG